jgi:hypothetical protein
MGYKAAGAAHMYALFDGLGVFAGAPAAAGADDMLHGSSAAIGVLAENICMNLWGDCVAKIGYKTCADRG